MKSHFTLSSASEEAIMVSSFNWYETEKTFIVNVNGESYTHDKHDIEQQQLDVVDFHNYYVYLDQLKQQYLTIKTPVDGLTTLGGWK